MAKKRKLPFPLWLYLLGVVCVLAVLAGEYIWGYREGYRMGRLTQGEFLNVSPPEEWSTNGAMGDQWPI